MLDNTLLSEKYPFPGICGTANGICWRTENIPESTGRSSWAVFSFLSHNLWAITYRIYRPSLPSRHRAASHHNERAKSEEEEEECWVVEAYVNVSYVCFMCNILQIVTREMIVISQNEPYGGTYRFRRVFILFYNSLLKIVLISIYSYVII